MDLGIAGKNALITGGSRGIGRATAWALAREGVNVAICARQLDRLEEVANEIRSATGVKVVAVQADMSVKEDIAGLVAKVKAELGSIDILVNNGVSFNVGTLTDDDWLHHFNVKVHGYRRAMEAVLPGMIEAGWGRVINVAGLAARASIMGQAINGSTAGATNSAIVNISKGVSDAVANSGVTVNVVHPGATDTDRHQINIARAQEVRGISHEEAEAATVAGIPIGRMIQPEEVAAMIAFYCSQQASAITGQTIGVDGGSVRGVTY